MAHIRKYIKADGTTIYKAEIAVKKEGIVIPGKVKLLTSKNWLEIGECGGRLHKVISCEKYTQLTGLFAHLLRCKNGCIARYASIFTPCR